jgi:serine/threonine protein kinase
MSVPTTTDQFLEYLTSSNVVDSDRLTPYLNECKQNNKLPDQPKVFANQLVRDGLLTPFQAQQLLAGRHRNFTFGKYRLLEPLGAGGMNKVFLCEHVVMRNRVAVKMLPRKKNEDPAKVARFFREARAVAALDHPNIVRAHDIDTSNEKYHYLVMEYVDGISLHDFVAKRGPLDPAHAANYIAQAAAGLEHIHQAGMIHRDLKPANLLLDRAGVVKILDLGLARFEDDEERITERYNDTSILGTVDFLSPEQTMLDGKLDIRSDIYGLGATFYFLLTARVPFEGNNLMKKLIAHQQSEPEAVEKLRSDVPPKLLKIQTRMMAKKPKQRFQTPAELLEALAPWTNIDVPPPREDELPRPSKGPHSSRSDMYVRSARTPMSSSVLSAPRSSLLLPMPQPIQRRRRWLLPVLVAIGIALTAAAIVGAMMRR